MILSIAAAVMYPLLQGAWEAGPLPSEYASAPMPQTHLEEADVKWQGVYYAKLSDPALRSAIIRNLSESSNGEAVKLLERLAKNEKDLSVRADAIASMLSLESLAAPSDQEFLKGLLKSASSAERANAAALLTNASKSPAAALEFLKDEKDASVHKALWPRLAAFKESLPREQVEQFLASKLPAARAGAAAAIAAAGWDGNNSKSIAAAAEDAEISVRFSVATALAAGKGGLGTLEKLSKDASPTIRAAVALSRPGEGREALLLALSADSDAAVRRNACESLSEYATPASAAALTPRLGDGDQFARAAAESSIGKIKPGREALDKIAALLESKEAQASACTALGLANDRASAPKVLTLLESRPDYNITARAVDTLKLLDYKPAGKLVASLAESKSANVRKGVAAALGVFKGSEGFPALRKLAKDKDSSISREAFRSMGLIGSASEFEDSIGWALGNLEIEAVIRSAASWAAARCDISKQQTIDKLKALSIEPCIPVPMSPEKMYDSDDSRASAMLALSALARKGIEPAAKAYAECLEAYHSPTARMETQGIPLLETLMEEYLRQMELLHKGATPAPAEVETVKPELAVKKL